MGWEIGKGSFDKKCLLQGCVYLKMGNVESAVKAYKALHGGWYKGNYVIQNQLKDDIVVMVTIDRPLK